MSVLEQITDDLSWRESELGSLKILMSRNNNSSKQNEVLLRAAWALLYAHYEGYSKFCLTIFFDEAQKRVSKCGALPIRTRELALGNKLKEIRSLSAADMLYNVEFFDKLCLDKIPSFPEVKTNSNLWLDALVKLLEYADINTSWIEDHKIKLRTLVSRRNDIAHGEKSMITDVDYYLTFEETVYEMMYTLAFLIDTRLTKPPYN